MHAYYLHGNWIDVQGSPTRIECTSSLQAGSAPFTFAWPDLGVATCMHAWACVHQSPHTREYFLGSPTNTLQPPLASWSFFQIVKQSIITYRIFFPALKLFAVQYYGIVILVSLLIV